MVKENPEFEYRNPKQIPMAKMQMSQTAALGAADRRFDLRIWDFGFVSSFGFRASDFYSIGS
jgi:hypothetical protein